MCATRVACVLVALVALAAASSVPTALASGSATATCAATVVTGQYRKDCSLDYAVYPSYNTVDPVDGGRVHLVMAAPGLKGGLVSVRVNNVEALNLTDSGAIDFTYLDWAKAMLDETTGEVWVALHSRNVAWLDTPGGKLTVQATAGNGACVAGSWEVSVSPVWFTWVTPLDAAGTGVIAHLHNNGTAPVNVTELAFDGVQVATTPPLPVTMDARSHLVLTFTAPRQPKSRGQLFTIQATTSVGVLANGGRVPEARFPIEAWPHSSDCGVPGANESSWQQLTSHGIDTVFYGYGDFRQHCGAASGNKMINEVINDVGAHPGANGGAYFFADTKTMTKGDGVNASGQTRVSAIYVTGEDDGVINTQMRQVLASAVVLAQQFPTVLTFQGGKTDRNDGAFAGVTDIQGMDFYVGACAPTITYSLAPLPLVGSFAFSRNTRNNQQPLPAMTYAQLFSDAWSYQARAPTIAMEIASVIAAGAKGLLLFQSMQSYFTAQPTQAAWDGLIKQTLLSIAHAQVRRVLRTGDVGGLRLHSSDGGDPTTDARSITEVVRSDDTILLLAINADATGYSNALCHVGADKYWAFQDHTISAVQLDVSADAVVTAANVADMKEVVGGELVPLAAGAAATLTAHGGAGAAVVVSHIELSAATPVRFFLMPYALRS